MKLDHVTLLVADLAVSADFYRKIPGLTLPGVATVGYLEVKNDGVTLGLFDLSNWQKETGATFEPNRGGAIVQFTVANVQQAYDAALAAGATSVAAPQHLPWGSESAYVSDPDGYLLEFYRWS